MIEESWTDHWTDREADGGLTGLPRSPDRSPSAHPGGEERDTGLTRLQDRRGGVDAPFPAAAFPALAC
ncbi:hypothetical protein [Streptomyces ficellus]|uniref:Uncharacterized protein n=1 Tax=Streptomyces ficellus TaxID=1977088 RepID=A0A6I6FAH0_9ACTN|nr:hypothetical protein [Streptomyces ficellus]QGV77182.1 hypothetical protein EIZ62_02145 [Streptomyces ficellus]